MKKLILSALLALTATAASAVPVLYTDNGHHYEVVSVSNMPWTDARDAASSAWFLGKQGHLVTISSLGENDFVNWLIEDNGGGERWGGAFQAADQLVATEGWTWLNGEGLLSGTDPLWADDEPNDAYGPGSEQYLAVNYEEGFNDEGNARLVRGFVIEFDTDFGARVPEAGTSALLAGFALAGLGLIARRSRR